MNTIINPFSNDILLDILLRNFDYKSIVATYIKIDGTQYAGCELVTNTSNKIIYIPLGLWVRNNEAASIYVNFYDEFSFITVNIYPIGISVSVNLCDTNNSANIPSVKYFPFTRLVAPLTLNTSFLIFAGYKIILK